MSPFVRRGALACALLTLLAGCSNGVEVDAPDLDRAERTACDELLALLPDEMEELDETEVSPDDAPARAWGDPAVIVTCGVSMPDDFDETSPCEEINGVGWFVRSDEFGDAQADLDMTTIGFAPAVRLQVPAEHRPPAGVMVTVSDAVKATLKRTGRCA